MILRSSRFVRIAVAATTLVLAAFHLVLLWHRVSDGSVLEPAVAAEWLAGLVLLLGLVRLHVAGPSLYRGRGAVILWVLIVLLHAVTVAPAGDGFQISSEREALVVPLGLAVTAAMLHVTRLLTELRRGRVVLPARRRAPGSLARLSCFGLDPALGCRAPPV